MRYNSPLRAVSVLTALLFLSCTKGSDAPRASSSPNDSATVTELTPAGSTKATTPAAPKGAQSQAGAMTAFDAAPPPSKASPADSQKSDAQTAQPQTDFRCGIKGTPVLTSLGMGNLQVGRTMAVVKQTCRVRRDIQEMNEGAPERVLTVFINNTPVRVSTENGLVKQIAISSSAFATRTGLRVGTSLARLVDRKTPVHLSEGEDGLYVAVEDYCGLSFRFSIPARETPGKRWTVDHVVKRYGFATADRILVTRCQG